MQLTDRNLEVGKIIVELTKQPSVSGRLIAALAEAKAILRKDPAKLAASLPIALHLFGDDLPSEIKSCRLAVMQALTAFHVERHPNARQFMLSIEGSGTIILKSRSGSQSSELGSDPSAPLSERWHVIPADRWHQPVPGKKDWAVLAFHSVPAGELIDDYEFPG